MVFVVEGATGASVVSLSSLLQAVIMRAAVIDSAAHSNFFVFIVIFCFNGFILQVFLIPKVFTKRRGRPG